MTSHRQIMVTSIQSFLGNTGQAYANIGKFIRR